MATKLEELQRQIEDLERQRRELLGRERTSALEEINARIRAFGFTPKDLNFGVSRSTGPGSGRSKGSVPMKYQKGNDLWSGRGRKPKWVENHLASGGKIDDLLIK